MLHNVSLWRGISVIIIDVSDRRILFYSYRWNSIMAKIILVIIDFDFSRRLFTIAEFDFSHG